MVLKHNYIRYRIPRYCPDGNAALLVVPKVMQQGKIRTYILLAAWIILKLFHHHDFPAFLGRKSRVDSKVLSSQWHPLLYEWHDAITCTIWEEMHLATVLRLNPAISDTWNWLKSDDRHIFDRCSLHSCSLAQVAKLCIGAGAIHSH